MKNILIIFFLIQLIGCKTYRIFIKNNEFHGIYNSKIKEEGPVLQLFKDSTFCLYRATDLYVDTTFGTWHIKKNRVFLSTDEGNYEKCNNDYCIVESNIEVSDSLLIKFEGIKKEYCKYVSITIYGKDTILIDPCLGVIKLRKNNYTNIIIKSPNIYSNSEIKIDDKKSYLKIKLYEKLKLITVFKDREVKLKNKKFKIY